MEAGRLQDAQTDFVAETGLDFSFIFALYEGASGYPATEDDCDSYADIIGNPDFPVMADGDKLLAAHTPMTQDRHPEMCALAPDMTIISCYAGHGGYDQALDAIMAHAGR